MASLPPTAVGLLLALSLLPAAAGQPAAPAAPASPYAQWKHGPGADATYFPVAVWLQDPGQAPRYKAAGINLYIGLWQGPTEAQLAALTKAGMPVVCDLNEVAKKNLDNPIIVGWMHGDEPDNAQPLGGGQKGYGPPIPPAKIVEDYQRIRATDPSRPVILNLGQGVAWDGWHGRGVRTNHPEDYAEYMQGGDVVSFDIYPVAHSHKDVQDKLWLVPFGVERLRQWGKDQKIVWNCIETSRIGEEKRKATPQQVRCEVWMGLIHGSRGIIYFAHEWKPKFSDHAFLDDPPMLEAITRTNQQIHELAPVLNSPTLAGRAKVAPADEKVPVDVMVKQHGGATYVFAVAMRPGTTKAILTVEGLAGKRQVEVLGENRTLEATDGKFEDAFGEWDVHLYKVK